MITNKQIHAILLDHDKDDKGHCSDELRLELWSRDSELDKQFKAELRAQRYYDKWLDKQGVPPISAEIFEESFWGAPF